MARSPEKYTERMFKVKKLFTLILALALTMGLAVPASAAGDTAQRGVLAYSEPIAPRYDDALSFSEGLAAVKTDGLWGYIDTKGNTVIPEQFDIAFSFSEGLALVGTLVNSDEIEDGYWDDEVGDYILTGNKYTLNYYMMGFVDTKGDVTWFSMPGFDENNVSPQIAVRSDEVLTGGEHIFYNGYVSLPALDDPCYYFFGTDGQLADLPEGIVSSSYDWQVTEDTAILGSMELYGGDQRFYNISSGKTITLAAHSASTGEMEPTYDLRPFNKGLAPVGVLDWSIDNWNYRWGFVDKSGKWVIQPTYNDFMVSGIYTSYQVFGDTGLAMVQNTQGKWGAIDKTGKTVIPFQYDALRPYYYGLAVFGQGGKFGYLDSKSQVAIPARYVNASGFSSDGYAAVYDGSRAFLIDTKGNAIPGTDKLDPDSYFTEDENGPVTVTPDEYVVICERGKYGFGHIDYTPALPEASEMSGWAYPLVTAAIEEDLVPNYLQNLYVNSITREEFCDLVIRAVEKVLDKDISDVVREKTGKSLADWQQSYPFTDTANPNVIAANALGIISGRGNGIFDPYSVITRQEAAALLTSSAKVLGMNTTPAQQTAFADNGDVAVYFRNAVSFVYQINVMSGTGNDKFSPLGTYTREQSFITVYRLFQAIMGQ